MQNNLGTFRCLFLVFISITQIAGSEIRLLTTTGKVIDDQGRPIGGVEIMTVPGRQKAVLSDSQGQFEIAWNPPLPQRRDTECHIIARNKEKNLALVLPMDDYAKSLKLTLKPAVSLSGRVVDPENNAINGAWLSLSIRFHTSISSVDSQNRTDRNGLFKIDAIPVENRYRITVKAEGYGQRSISFDAKDAVNGHIELGQVELAVANMSVTGRVVDITGHPVPGIEVYCTGEGQPSCHIKSDEQGYFALDGVCAGLVRFFAEGQVDGKNLADQVLTEAGARDVKVVVTEHGYSRSRYIRTKSHEGIIKSGNPYIAGWVVDENGVAVADVPVMVRCMQSKNEKGQDTVSYFQIARFGDVTDNQGHFAIELEEKATYSLLFSPINHAAMIAYDVVTGTKDLKVVLSNGGTITGQLVRFSRGKEIPVPNAKVELKQTNRNSYSYLGYDRDRKTMTDSQGRFRFEHIRTLMRTDQKRSVFGPRFWELRYGDTSQTVMFLPDETVNHIDLVIRPNITEAASLIGKALPDFTGINIDFRQDRFRDRKILICFFDYTQRPARHCILELNGQLPRLREQDIEIVAVQASKTAGNELDQWIKKMNISIPVDTINCDIDETRFIWNVRFLPWLILTDKEHIVRGEGFSLEELNEKTKQAGDR